MASENKHLEAANKFAQAATILERGHDLLQARLYAVRAAELYLQSGNESAAAEQYLFAAQTLFNKVISAPELGRAHLDEARKIAVRIDDPDLRIRELIARSQIDFASFDDDNAHRCLKHAQKLLLRIPDDRRRNTIMQDIVLRQANFHMIVERFEDAAQALQLVLDECPEDAYEARLNLYRIQMIIEIELGRWENVNQIYNTANLISETQSDLLAHRGHIMMHFGSSLAQRGQLDQAYDVFHDALELLTDGGDVRDLELAYRTTEYMLLRNGAFYFKDFNQHDARRMDLFRKNVVDNQGYWHQIQAAKSLGEKDYRETIRHCRLALGFYWREGDWSGLSEVYKTLASLHLETSKLDIALMCAIRAEDGKIAEEISRRILQEGETELQLSLIDKLICARSNQNQLNAAVKAIGVLADIVPATSLSRTIDFLIEVIIEPDDTHSKLNLLVIYLKHLSN